MLLCYWHVFKGHNTFFQFCTWMWVIWAFAFFYLLNCSVLSMHSCAWLCQNCYSGGPFISRTITASTVSVFISTIRTFVERHVSAMHVTTTLITYLMNNFCWCTLCVSAVDCIVQNCEPADLWFADLFCPDIDLGMCDLDLFVLRWSYCSWLDIKIEEISTREIRRLFFCWIFSSCFQTEMEKFQWRHPLRLRSSPKVPKQLESRLDNNCIMLDVDIQELGVSAECCKLQ